MTRIVPAAVATTMTRRSSVVVVVVVVVVLAARPLPLRKKTICPTMTHPLLALRHVPPHQRVVRHRSRKTREHRRNRLPAVERLRQMTTRPRAVVLHRSKMRPRRAAVVRLRRKHRLAARLRQPAAPNRSLSLNLSKTVPTRRRSKTTRPLAPACPTRHAAHWLLPPVVLLAVNLPAPRRVTLKTTIRCRKTTRIRLRLLKSPQRKTHPRLLPVVAAQVPTSKPDLLSSRVVLDRYGQEKAAS